MARLQAFGPYQLVERIGVGAMGEVFRAVSRRDGRVVALKRLIASASGNADAVAMLESEAELVRGLDHPAISKVADVGQVDGVHYIAYEYVHGRDLRAIQDRALRRGLPPASSGRRPTLDGEGQPVALDVAIYVVLRVAEALEHAHARHDAQGRPLQLVHRDVSPTNVLVSFDGAVKLLDFGIARAAGLLVRTDAGQVKGTVGYMSPEQIHGEPVDGRSDLYSLGICLWELSMGRRLVDSAEVAARVVAGQVPSPRAGGAKISEAVERIILKALAKSPDHRYAGATELHADLSRQAGAEGLLTDSVRVAHYVRSLFPEAAAEEAASREESLDMADNKGGSDLDVFEGLAKKATRPATPGLTPPPPSQVRKPTLQGGHGPLPPPVSPPSPGPASAAGAPPMPVPSSKPAGSLPPPVAPPNKSGTLPGLSTLSALPGAAPPPPPPAPSRLPPPPSAPPPPPVAAATSTVPPVPLPAPPPPVPPPARPPFPPAPSAQEGSTAAKPPSPEGGSVAAKPPPAPLPPPSPPAHVKASPPKPLPPPAAPPKDKDRAGKAAVDMDWDDEEESTHVYDKADGEASPLPSKPPKVGGAAALLASSGGAARSVAPPPGLASSVPPPPPVPGVPVEALSRRDEPTAIRPRPAVPAPPSAQAGGSRLPVFLGGLALLAALGALGYTLMPRKGTLKINVSAKSGATVGAVDVYIDGQKKCEATPCVLADVDLGSKTIKVIAPGFLPAEQTAMIEARKENLITVPLETNGSGSGSVPAVNGQVAVATGGGPVLKIAGTDSEKSVHVYVDGADKGTLPVELKELSAGSHKVRFDGGDRYEKSEQSIDLSAGQTKDLGEIKLKVVKGQVTLDIVTSGVAVTLVRRGDKKTEKKVTDAMLKNPPVRLDIDTSESWRLVATKKGFDDFTQDLTFEDGQADKTVKIELFETGKPAPPPPNPGGNVAAPPPPDKKGQDTSAAASDAGGTLNINSIPPSKVILDGKPLGSTPKVGVSVSAGSHTVTFIHPDLGKQTVTVKVKNGETKTAAVKFNK